MRKKFLKIELLKRLIYPFSLFLSHNSFIKPHCKIWFHTQHSFIYAPEKIQKIQWANVELFLLRTLPPTERKFPSQRIINSIWMKENFHIATVKKLRTECLFATDMLPFPNLVGIRIKKLNFSIFLRDPGKKGESFCNLESFPFPQSSATSSA